MLAVYSNTEKVIKINISFLAPFGLCFTLLYEDTHLFLFSLLKSVFFV
jgi:hypothetical protein